MVGIDQIAQELRRAGMTVDQVLSVTGVITGSIDVQRVATVSRLPGVASVEPDADTQTPRPDGGVP